MTEHTCLITLRDCWLCKGIGRLILTEILPSDFIEHEFICPVCNGDGSIPLYHDTDSGEEATNGKG